LREQIPCGDDNKKDKGNCVVVQFFDDL